MMKMAWLLMVLVGVGFGFLASALLGAEEISLAHVPAAITARGTAIAEESQATVTALRGAQVKGTVDRSPTPAPSTPEPVQSPSIPSALVSPSFVPSVQTASVSPPTATAVACADTSDQPPQFEFAWSALRNGRVETVECPTPIGTGDPRDGWPHSRNGNAWFEDGTYRLSAHQPGAFVAIRAPLGSKMSDVRVSATFRKLGGPPGGGFGLIVRDQGTGGGDGIDQRGRFYVLEVGDKGEIGVWRRDDDRWIDLVAWTPSSAVRPGNAENVVVAHAIGTRLTLLVNDVQVAEVEDAALADGAVGMFTGGDSNVVAVSRFRVDGLGLR
jgi:hypothetical protein